MQEFLKALRGALLGTTALVAVSGVASAADLSYKDEPAMEEARKFGISAYVAGTTDYVFRGISQTDENPTVQGAIDVTYGILYAGVWASGLDFDDEFTTSSSVEIDIYAGIKPTWNGVTFDFGALYYYYPGTERIPAVGAYDLDYVEIKAGISGNLTDTLSASFTAYYSPDYSGELGESGTFEGTLTKTLPKMGRFDIAISGTLGYFVFDEDKLPAPFGTTDLNDYLYGNIGITATKGNYSLDVRFHATDLDEGDAPANAGDLTTDVFQGDERVVGTLKVVLP